MVLNSLTLSGAIKNASNHKEKNKQTDISVCDICYSGEWHELYVKICNDFS